MERILEHITPPKRALPMGPRLREMDHEQAVTSEPGTHKGFTRSHFQGAGSRASVLIEDKYKDIGRERHVLCHWWSSRTAKRLVQTCVAQHPNKWVLNAEVTVDAHAALKASQKQVPFPSLADTLQTARWISERIFENQHLVEGESKHDCEDEFPILFTQPS